MLHYFMIRRLVPKKSYIYPKMEYTGFIFIVTTTSNIFIASRGVFISFGEIVAAFPLLANFAL